MRVVIGEDEVLQRQGLVMVLERAGFDVAAVAGDAEDLLRKTLAHRPDLMVTDIRMPPEQTDEGLRVALDVRAREPRIAIVVLSHHVQRRYATELLTDREGAAGVGYLLKHRVTDVKTFCASVRRVCRGGTVLDPQITAMLVARASHDGPLARLTPRQVEVLDLVAQGRSNAAIAERLSISEKAVVKHVSHVYDQLGLPPSPEDHRRVLAVLRHLSVQAG